MNPKRATLPDATGHFGRFGGRYVPETLMPALLDLEKRQALSIPDDIRAAGAALIAD